MTQPKVTIEQGTLQGSVDTDWKGNSFYKFQGIPYAKPPLGTLRFKAPQPPEKWVGVLDATKEGQVCIHVDPLKNDTLVGGEDCLFINVFTKQLPEANPNLRPVLVWIHGGGFWFGSGNEDQYGPHFLISEDVVVVTFNYRLGLLGFLSFKDSSLEVPGNAGLKDQVMALKWVQKNISKFGGDPRNVTIFGESAGGAAVHLQTLSPLSRGLFHKAIIQSGCALNPWAQGKRGCDHLNELMGLQDTDEQKLYEILMQKSVKEIFQIQINLFESSKQRNIGFVLEPNLEEAFITEEPIELIKKGQFSHVPIMIGYTTSEGMIFELLKRNLSDFQQVIPSSFGYEYNSPEAQKVANKIKRFYFAEKELSDETLKNKIDMISDSWFVFGIHRTVLSQFEISKTPTYLYRMSLETEMNILKKRLKLRLPGVSHFDDIGYLFKNFATPEIRANSREEMGVGRFIRLWCNFAKHANPTPGEDSLLNTKWQPVTSPNLDFLDIGDELIMKSNPDETTMCFWKRLFAESPAGQKCK